MAGTRPWNYIIGPDARSESRQRVKTTIRISDNAVEFITINPLALNIVRASFCSAAGSISCRSSRDRRQTTVVSRGRLQDTRFRQPSSKAVHGATSDSRLQSVCSSPVATDVRQRVSRQLGQQPAGEPESCRRARRAAGEPGEPAGEPESCDTVRLLDSVTSSRQCSWRNNRRTATSVNCRWTNASLREDIDHPRAHGISRWIAAWIARH